MTIRNWVKCAVSGAPGVGNIGIGAAPAGFMTFATAGFVTGQFCHYTVTDGNNREFGYGLYTSGAPDTITRSVIIETLVVGVFDDTSPAPINITASATVEITDAAQHISPAPSTLIPPVSGFSGRIYSSYTNRTLSNVVMVANKLYAIPFPLKAPALISSVFLYNIVTAAAAGSIARIGLYNCGVNTLPGTVLIEGNGTLLVDATGLNKTIPLAVAKLIPAGKYWMAIISDGTPTLAGYNSNAQTIPDWGGKGNGRALTSLTLAITAGWTAMPDLTGTTPGASAVASSPITGLQI